MAQHIDGKSGSARIHLAHRLLRARDWQHRPQLDQLCDWWRAHGSAGGGICGLVGIGGAGKTAVVDRFLRAMPRVLPEAEVPQDDTLPTPDSLFVFSFYDVPNPDSFFAQLAAWLKDQPYDESARQPSYEQTIQLLERHGQAGGGVGLLVLDGLEKAQQDGLRGTVFGRIADGRLRDFVLRAAEGWLPGIAVVITTRFRLFDALQQRSPLFMPIAVDQLDPDSAVGLLRARGVRGPDHVLDALARDQGYHALTVDLLGGYIAQFRGGDPARLPPERVLPPQAESDLDPETAAIREQERKFARVAARYAEALRRSDPAALALLQRVCLFRLGVTAEILASIFTGEDKQKVSGKDLARLKQPELQAKLDLLVAMHLLESSGHLAAVPGKSATSASEAVYTIHPAIRDGFLRDLDKATTKASHDAAREGLTTSLGGLAGIDSDPSDPRTLDLLEEIIYHTLAAGHPREAWDIYWDRIGAFKNLLWRLGAYERGERICRAFAGGRAPEDAPFPKDLSENAQGACVNEWGLYLSNLGHLDAAARCYERVIELSLRQENWSNASNDNQNLTDVLLADGRLAAGLRAAEEALRLADRANDPRKRQDSYAYRAYARVLRGETSGALDDFRQALHWQHEADGEHDKPLYSNLGVWHTLLLARLDQYEEATRLAQRNIEILDAGWGPDNHNIPWCRLILADLTRQRGDIPAARESLHRAHDWALARGAKELLCWSALVRGRIALTELRRVRCADQSDGADTPNGPHSGPYNEARTAIEDGLRIARDCGYGIHHIDLLTLRTQVGLHQGRAADAERDARIALTEGVHPPKGSGLPELLAATDPECGYAWGEGDTRHVLAEALLLQAAQQLGRSDFAPAATDKLPAEVRTLIDQARQKLTQAAAVRKRIRDPKLADTKRVLKDLKGGVLTTYPLHPVAESSSPAAETTPTGDTTVPVEFDVILSHNSKDKPTVRVLAEKLKARGLKVWLDEWELVPGRPWQVALEDIIATAKTAAVLVGQDGLGPWEDREMRGCLSEFVGRGMPVIPVLLPGARKKPKLPLFLKQFTWVDLRQGIDDEGLQRLEWGIRGHKPA